jgi:prepilin-type processing-associated H-X9-DG protein
MYCPKCGLDNLEDEKICKSCSQPLPVIPDLPPEISKTSKLAIWSFVLSLMGIFTFMVTALPAIICGIIGLVKISKSNGRLKGKGYAITGITLPFVYIVLISILGIFSAILFPALGQARQSAQKAVCMNNLKTIGIVIITYTSENNDTYPPAENWCDLLKDKVKPENLICPASKKVEGQTSYALNINVAGRKTSEIPPDTVLLFETTIADNPVGSYELLDQEKHNGHGFNILFADGRVEFIDFGDSDKQSSLRWKPE